MRSIFFLLSCAVLLSGCYSRTEKVVERDNPDKIVVEHHDNPVIERDTVVKEHY